MRPTAAEVAGERFANLLFRRLGVLIEQCLGAHDHAVGAVAALGCLLLDERPLDRMRILRRAEPLERRDARLRCSGHRCDARAYRPAIHDHGACTTLGSSAAELRPVQAEVIAQNAEQRRLRLDVKRSIVPVDSQRNAHTTNTSQAALRDIGWTKGCDLATGCATETTGRANTMSIESWVAFAAASAILLVIPGPTILTVIGYSVAQGRRAALPLIAAVALGDSTALALSLVGLGTLLAASAVAFTIVKLAGAVYLIYLGVTMLRAGFGTSALTATSAVEGSRWRLFLNTYIVTATNPKGIIFFVAFLPQFVDTAAGSAGKQLWILAITFVSLAIVNATVYTIFAGYAAARLASGKARRWFNLGGGSLLSAAGLWIALGRRVA